MPTPDEKSLDRMLKTFETQYDTARNHPGKNLRELIDKTPELKAVVLDSIHKGNLDKFENLSYPGAVGTYDATGKSMAVSIDQLRTADHDKQSANTLRFTLGHELQHAVNRKDILDQDATLHSKASAIAHGTSPHDYTAILKDYNTTSRELETNAEIAGFNMLASTVRRENPKATLKDLYDASPNDMGMYVKVDLSKTPATYTPKAGLTLDADLKIASTKENVEAMGKYFYDANGYPKGEIGRAIGMVQGEEVKALHDARVADPKHAKPEIDVDLKALGISRPLPPGFTDISKPRLHRDARGTASAHEAGMATPAHAANDPRRAEHPDHAYFQLLRDKLPSSVPDNAVAHAMVLAKQDGMGDPSKVNHDQIALANGQVWIGGNTPGFRVNADPAHAPPMEQVTQNLDAVRQQDHAQQQTSRTQAETRQVAPLSQ